MSRKTLAGNYSHRATIQRMKASATIDAAGHIDETDASNWETYLTRWCRRITKGSREYIVDDQMNANATEQIRIRWDEQAEAIDTSMRIKIEGRALSIASPPINVDAEDREVVMSVIEVK